MLTLCGFSASNYYNKVKLALLEKGVPFQEQLAWVGQTDLAASPLGKVPYLLTPEGPLCESAVIADYIEAAYPTPALVPAQAFAAAKVRELITFMVRLLGDRRVDASQFADASRRQRAGRVSGRVPLPANLECPLSWESSAYLRRASISAVLVLRSALMRCTCGRSAMRAR